jgi:diguanylate cyclase (GGDEF)-like protein
MQQVLAVAASRDWPTGLDLRPYALSQVSELDPHAVLWSIDAVLVVPGSSAQVASTARIVNEARRDGDIAMLLAGKPRSQPLHGPLTEHPFDGVVDLDWPEALLCAAIETAVRNVKVGRNTGEIQRAVLGLHDAPTHRHFTELMAREHERSRRGQPYALVFIHLDNLEGLNRRHGHAAGSSAVDEMSQVLSESLRSSDAALQIGGDAFVLFLSGCTSGSANALATRLCERLRERTFRAGELELSITLSAGIASYPDDGGQYPELLARAHQALSWAKAAGRDQAVVWSAELAASTQESRRER